MLSSSTPVAEIVLEDTSSSSDDDDNDEEFGFGYPYDYILKKGVKGPDSDQSSDMDYETYQRAMLKLLVSDELKKEFIRETGIPNPTDEELLLHRKKNYMIECQLIINEVLEKVQVGEDKANAKGLSSPCPHDHEYQYCCIVKALPLDISIAELRGTFSSRGEILQTKIISNHKTKTGVPEVTGFVSYASEKSMINAVAELNGTFILGCRVTVHKAQSHVGGSKDDHEYEHCCIVNGIPSVLPIAELNKAFSPHGEILRSKIISNHKTMTGVPEVSAYVSLASEKSMINAVAALNGTFLWYCYITVHKAQSHVGSSKDGIKHRLQSHI